MTDGPETAMPQARAVLVLEDDWLIALDIAGLLQEAGLRVIGPVSTAAGAMDLLNTTPIAVALLDVNLGDERSYDVARALRARRIPFAFLSGYLADDIDPEFRGHVLINKPFAPNRLLHTLLSLMDAPA